MGKFYAVIILLVFSSCQHVNDNPNKYPFQHKLGYDPAAAYGGETKLFTRGKNDEIKIFDNLNAKAPVRAPNYNQYQQAQAAQQITQPLQQTAQDPRFGAPQNTLPQEQFNTPAYPSYYTAYQPNNRYNLSNYPYPYQTNNYSNPTRSAPPKPQAQAPRTKQRVNPNQRIKQIINDEVRSYPEISSPTTRSYNPQPVRDDTLYLSNNNRERFDLLSPDEFGPGGDINRQNYSRSNEAIEKIDNNFLNSLIDSDPLSNKFGNVPEI